MKYAIWAFTFTLCACSAGGTGTGNPITPAASDPGSSVSTVSGNIFFQVCKVLERCNPGMTDAICGNGIANLTGFAPKLGLTSTPAPAPQQIIIQEFNHQVTADPVAGDKCIAQMLKLQCNDPLMQNAYDASAAIPFAGTPDILDPVCAGVLTSP